MSKAKQKSSNPIVFFPIGTIHSPFKDVVGMPIQPNGAQGIRGTIKILPEFIKGLKDLIGFSHLILLYHFHLSKGYELKPRPFLDTKQRGVFATRAPRRPNPIGLSTVRLERIDELTIHIIDVDILDGTPLLDIKPYVPEFDHRPRATIGWLYGRATQANLHAADDRFGE